MTKYHRIGGLNKISSQFWRLEAQDKSAGRGGFSWGLSPWLTNSCRLAVFSHGLSLVCSQLWYLSVYTDFLCLPVRLAFPGGSAGKESTRNVGNLGLIPGLGRSSGGGSGNPLQYSCLENFMDRGPWQAIVHGVEKSQTRLSDKQQQIWNMLLKKSREITPERIKRWSQSKNNAQLWMLLVMEVTSNAAKGNIA